MNQHEAIPATPLVKMGRNEEEGGSGQHLHKHCVDGEQYDFCGGESDMDSEEREELERFLESLQE